MMNKVKILLSAGLFCLILTSQANDSVIFTLRNNSQAKVWVNIDNTKETILQPGASKSVKTRSSIKKIRWIQNGNEYKTIHYIPSYQPAGTFTINENGEYF